MIAPPAPGHGLPDQSRIEIPPPGQIERRLYDLKLEVALLRRLLRVSRDRATLASRNAEGREAARVG